MSTAWNKYLQPGDVLNPFSECSRRCRSSFDQHRRNIRRVFEATKPAEVACLGAGALNDIPYEAMVRSETGMHLVDWVSGSIDAGIALSIIQTNEGGDHQCLYCMPPLDCPEKYCRNYDKPEAVSSTVCKNFRPSGESPLRCEAFQRSDRPLVHYQDVTGGFAGEFGRQLLAELHGVRSWKQAFARASALSDRISRQEQTQLTIADSSVDLVTSSMVMSQFDHEPYEYFAHQTTAMLGRPTEKEEMQLRSTTESFRSALLLNQVRRHCQEIKRILRQDGRCYMAFELFHLVPRETCWFLVKGASEALDTIAGYFHFNFDIISEDMLLTRFQTSDTPSLSCAFVLEMKSA